MLGYAIGVTSMGTTMVLRLPGLQFRLQTPDAILADSGHRPPSRLSRNAPNNLNTYYTWKHPRHGRNSGDPSGYPEALREDDGWIREIDSASD